MKIIAKKAPETTPFHAKYQSFMYCSEYQVPLLL